MAFTIPRLLSLSHIKSAVKMIAAHFDNVPELNENNKIAPSLIDTDSNNRFVTDTEKETWNSSGGGDLSDYQLKSEKGEAGGYLSLDENKTVPSYTYLTTPKSRISYFINCGGSASNLDGLTYTGLTTTGYTGGQTVLDGQYSPIKSGSTVKTIHRSAKLNPSTAAVGRFNIYSNSYVFYLLNATDLKATIDIAVSLKSNNSTTNNLMAIGAGGHARGAGTNTVTGTDGIWVEKNPTVNSGKWRIGYKVGADTTYIDLNTDVIYDNLIRYKFVYEKNALLNRFAVYINDIFIQYVSANFNIDFFSPQLHGLTIDPNDSDTNRILSVYNYLVELDLY